MLDREHVSQLLGVSVRSDEKLGRHHSWTLHRVRLNTGHDVFIKAADGGCGTVFLAEASGLRWLADDDPSLPLPPVLGVDERMLILPWLPQGSPSTALAERLGRDLAELHRRPAITYGAPWQGWIADIPLDNIEHPGPWSTWYAEYRLLPFLRLGAQYLASADVRLVERVIDRIDLLAGPPEPPSRIHGDLWPGNVYWSTDRAILIDPAAHGGHRETDLAMLAMFGGISHLDRILAAYDETFPLADGWQDRVPLHQLHNLLVHVALFGTGYGDSVRAAAEALVCGPS